MSEVKIKELDKSLIHQANSNSMSGKRGDISAHEYEVYCQKVMSWNIPDSRKQKIVDQIYAKWSEQLRHEAAHVSVAVAGPARYNAKKLDHSDTILRLSSEFVEWFNGLQEQVWQGRIEDKDAKEIARLVDDIKFCIERPTLNPTASLCELANKDPELFMEYYEKLHEKYRWRKNSVVAKLYAAGKEGKLAKLWRKCRNSLKPFVSSKCASSSTTPHSTGRRRKCTRTSRRKRLMFSSCWCNSLQFLTLTSW